MDINNNHVCVNTQKLQFLMMFSMAWKLYLKGNCYFYWFILQYGKR